MKGLKFERAFLLEIGLLDFRPVFLSSAIYPLASCSLMIIIDLKLTFLQYINCLHLHVINNLILSRNTALWDPDLDGK